MTIRVILSATPLIHSNSINQQPKVQHAIVVQEPGWWGRLWGQRRLVSFIHTGSVMSGALSWFYDATNVEVDPDVKRAIERQEINANFDTIEASFKLGGKDAVMALTAAQEG